jgi:hypothetical protein
MNSWTQPKASLIVKKKGGNSNSRIMVKGSFRVDVLVASDKYFHVGLCQTRGCRP